MASIVHPGALGGFSRSLGVLLADRSSRSAEHRTKSNASPPFDSRFRVQQQNLGLLDRVFEPMRPRKGSQKRSHTRPPNAVQQEVPSRANTLRAESIKLRVAELDALIVELEQKLNELEAALARKRELNPSNDTSFAKLSKSTSDSAMETRCQNLRDSLKTVKRLRLAAQIELAITLQD